MKTMIEWVDGQIQAWAFGMSLWDRGYKRAMEDVLAELKAREDSEKEGEKIPFPHRLRPGP